MKKRTLIVLVLALALATVSLAAEGIWTTKSPMPTARWVLSSGVVDGKIYVIGGQRKSMGNVGELYQSLQIRNRDT